MHYAWNVISQTLTHTSTPAPASLPVFCPLPSSSQSTVLIPPIPAFLILMFLPTSLTLQMYRVSQKHSAGCRRFKEGVDSGGQWFVIDCASKVCVNTRKWYTFLDSIGWSSHLTTCDKPQSVMILIQQQKEEESTTHITSTQRSTFNINPSGENASAFTVPLLPLELANSFYTLPSHSYRCTFWSYIIINRYHRAWNKILTSPPNATNLLIWQWESPLQKNSPSMVPS